MRILLLGATGATGRHVLELLRGSRHGVRVLVREARRLEVSVGPSLEVVEGDVMDPDTVARAMVGQDVVVSALGTGMSLRSDGLFTAAAHAVTAAAATAGVRQVVWLSSFGVGSSFDAASDEQKQIYGTMLRELYADKATADDVIRRSGLDWTLVYPTKLTDGPALGGYQAGDALPMSGDPTISRADVARFIVSTLEDPLWSRRTAVISD